MSAVFEPCNHPGCNGLIWLDREWVRRDAEARAQKEGIEGEHYRRYEILHNGHAFRWAVHVGLSDTWFTDGASGPMPRIIAEPVQLRFGCYPLEALLP